MRQQLVHLGNGAHALATQILGSPDDAADAVHDAFAVALSKPDAFDASKGSLKTWFFRVVHNRCIDLIRRRRPDDFDISELSDSGLGPEQILELSQRDAFLNKAIRQLKSEQRQIIVLRDYLDLSYAEIAIVLDLANGTVMSRLHRARMALKEELSRHDG